jgi:photosystem II stability/assembly factor-like uncharacterized protein
MKRTKSSDSEKFMEKWLNREIFTTPRFRLLLLAHRVRKYSIFASMKRYILLSVLLLAAPAAQGQWVQADGINGGPPGACVAIGTTLFLSSSEKGVSRSNDFGITWIPANNGLSSSHVSCLAVIGNNLFAGTNDIGVFLSTDMGDSWSLADNGLLNNLQINDLTVMGDTLYAAGKYGIFLSTNNGAFWKSAGLTDSSVTNITAAGSILIAVTFTFEADGSYYSTFRSADQGLEWQDISFEILSALSTSLPEYTQKPVVIGTYLFMAFDYQGVVRSTNGGLAWDTIFVGEAGYTGYTLGASGSKLFISSQVYGFGSSFYSEDSGVSWVQDSSLPYFQSIITAGSNLLATTDGSILLSTDEGIKWNEVNTSGLTQEPVLSLLVKDSTLYAGSGIHGMYRSTNYGLSWMYIPAVGDTCIYSITSIGNQILCVGNQMYSSINNGLTWDTITNSFPRFSQLHSIIASGTNVFTASYDSIYRSNDSGRSWSSVGTGFPQYPGIQRLAANSTALFAGTNENGVYRSVDNGSTWAAINSGLQTKTILAMLATDNQVFAGTSDGAFISDDNGANWSATGLDGSSVYSFTMSNNTLFAMTSTGIFLTTSNGSSWIDATTGLDGTPTSSTICGPYLFAGATGVWRRPLSEMIGSNSVEVFSLSETSITIYPNPFTQSTTINFTSTESGTAEVTILNLLGAEIARVYEGELSTGEHSFTWDASGAAPGMYECVVRVNGNVQRTAIMRGATNSR